MTIHSLAMRCGEIIAVGSELLLGARLDSNSIFLSERLAALGVEVRFKAVVGDETSDIVAAIRTAAGRSDVVLLTGGLGSTRDDCTRDAVARVSGRPLRQHPAALENMRKQLAAWGRVPTAAQLRQALIPAGAEVLANPGGSAPGFCLSWRGAFLAALPGVPDEAKQMFAREVAPRLTRLNGLKAERIERRILHTFGLPETDIDQKLSGKSFAGILRANGTLRLGLLASPFGVSVELTAFGISNTANGRKRLAALLRVEQRVRRRLAQWIYATGDETMEQVVGRHLRERGLTLAVAESCTGGLIGHRLTEVPGSSEYVERIIVSYSNRAKVELLGVPEQMLRTRGAVSEEVAAAMATGARARSRADVGLSVTGVAGPDGGTPTKPVGLVYVGLDPGSSGSARRPKGHTQVHQFRFYGNRQAIKLRASQAALDLLRQWLSASAGTKA
ncbi:MAG TPA: competence/damage-inducible protein A, partial [Nitrospiraceae bacterium]|nr:competence/damage-inducible protein A [Nitrospiraceae bacterium]